MIESNRHIIHKLNLEVEFTSNEDVYRLTDKIYELFQEEILPYLEQLLNSIDNKDRIIRIEEINLDFGSIDPALPDHLVIAEMKELLQEQLPREFMEKSSAFSQPGSFTNAPPDDVIRAGILSPKLALIEAFKYFILTGSLHWSTTTEEFDEWERKLVEILVENDEEAVKQLRKFFHSLHQSQVKRLVLQFSFDFIKLFSKRILPASYNLVLESEELLAPFLNDLSNRMLRRFTQRLYVIYYLSVLQEVTIVPVELVRMILSESKIIAKSEFRAIQVKMQKVVSEELTVPDTLKEVIERIEISDSIIHPVKEEKSGRKLSIPYKLESESDYPEYFIENAGLVLLHPFLKPFLEEFELVKDDEFVDEASQEKAVGLLQYLVTGQTEFPEHELLLNKLLVGLDVDHPLERDFDMSEEEMQEAENLLRTAIRYWDKLKNTSPDGLRGGFLKRKGKLSLREEGWVLTVEPQQIDVLLDYIPWNISLIKLPWLEEVFRVEWTG